MPDHQAPGRPLVRCFLASHGRCRICELIQIGGPHYQEAYRRLYHPEEFPLPLPEPEPEPPVVVPPAAGPGMLRKVANLARATAQHAMAGLPMADDATAESRLAICRGCDKFNAAAASCSLCGCDMPLKVTWLEQRCPIGKW